MTQNLTLALSAGTPVVAASNTSRDTISFIPTSCGTNGACSINGNTRAGNGTYYYSWYAATAETGTSSNVNVDTPTSICPVGWRLPANYTIDPNKSYGSLTDAYNFTSGGASNSQNHVSQLESYPLNFARSGGYYSSGSLTDTGFSGNYWLSTAGIDAAHASLSYYHTSVGTVPQANAYKYSGYNVRCVAL